MYRAIYWQSWEIAISFQDKRRNTEKELLLPGT
jgi:hypothetical protein